MAEYKHVVCPHCQGINRVPEDRLTEGPKCGVCSRPLFDGSPVELNQATFGKHVQKNDIPVLVDFWAPWCGPCKMMAPVFARTAAQLSPRVRFAKVNTEEERALAMEYNIRSIPTLALFRNGREVDRVAGALDQSSLVRWVQQHL